MTLVRLVAGLALLVLAAPLSAADDKAPKSELEANAATDLALIFVVMVSPRSREVFDCDSPSRVTGFGDRREGRDMKWRRLS